MKLTLSIFTGANKALHEKLVPDSAGVDSQNQKPGRGDFQPWHVPLQVATVPTARGTIYRFGRDVKSDANYWWSFTGRVHLVRGYNAEDTTERTYFTGSGAPKWTDNTIAGTVGTLPLATRTLGVPAPATAAIVTSNADGTAENTESRYVTYTYVNTKGDESAPAPASAELVCKTDDTMSVASLAAAPGGYDIDRIRVYATVSGQSGETEFFFQKEISSGLSSTTISAILADDVLETTGWLEPPSDLSCLTPMWNGMLAGISGKGVRVCAAFSPYAWPIEYELLPADRSPVGLGHWRQNLLILTTGQPEQVSGTSPDSLDSVPVPGQACASEPSIVSFDHGVAYACEDGLAYYGEGRAPGLITAGLFTRDDWQEMNPDTMSAGIYEGAYLGFYTDGDGVRRGFLLDPINPQGVFFLSTGYDAVYFDELQDALYVYDAATGAVSKWDAGAAFMTATYRGKKFTTPSVNFAWGKVTADTFPLTLKIDAGPFTADQLTALVATNPGELSAVGTTLRATIAVADAEPFRLPAGFLATEWQPQVETTGPVQAVVLATDVRETA